jgi:endonuclease VIII
VPEGDTIHRLAARLRPALEGKTARALWLRDRGDVPELTGVAIEEVVALGKHLLIALGARHVFHGHLGMHGKWFAYRHGEAWRRSPATAVARIDTADGVFVCFRAPVAEVLRRIELSAHPVLSRLGPDLLAPEVDFARVVRRARRSDARSVADLLLDQRVACGIGNVYKNEVLFVERVQPWTEPAALDDAQIESLYRRARELMQRNLGGWKRTTVAQIRAEQPWPRELPRVFVYGRGGEPCLRCGGAIASRRQGDAARTTFWCARCQSAPAQYVIDASHAPRGSS